MQPDGKLEAGRARNGGGLLERKGIGEHVGQKKISRNHVFKWEEEAAGYRVLGQIII